MRRRGDNRTALLGWARGFTMVEIMVATVLVSIMVLVLGQVFNVAAANWSSAQRSSDMFGDARAALDLMRKDLGGAIGSRQANLAPLPDDVSSARRSLFEGRLIVPFEVDRQNGKDMRATFLNAEPIDGENRFSSLGFVQAAPLSRHINAGTGGIGERSTVTLADSSLCGYYVAFTQNSRIAGSPKSMKLFRHFRPSGSPEVSGASRARGYLIRLTHEMNRRDEFDPARNPAPEPALLQTGVFGNGDMPNLFAKAVFNEDTYESEVTMQPWPADPLVSPYSGEPELPFPPLPFPPPDRSDPEAWRDPAAPLHWYLYADEPIVRNVVRFSARPYKWVDVVKEGEEEVEPVAERRLMGAKELNAYLELGGGDEWPVLVAPDFIDFTLSVISDETAAKLLEREDWYFDWSKQSREVWDWKRQLVEKEMKTFRVRIHLRESR